MESLKNYVKNYIKDYIAESIWDVDDNIESNNDEVVISEAKRFIKDNYETVDLNRLTFVFDEDKEKFEVGYAGDLKLNDGAESIVVSRDTGVGNSIEQSGLAHIGQTNDT